MNTPKDSFDKHKFSTRARTILCNAEIDDEYKLLCLVVSNYINRYRNCGFKTVSEFIEFLGLRKGDSRWKDRVLIAEGKAFYFELENRRLKSTNHDYYETIGKLMKKIEALEHDPVSRIRSFFQ